MDDPNNTTENRPIILLDTNIIQYSSSKSTSPKFIQFLIETNKKGILAVSEYSRFELIRGAKTSLEQELLKTFELFKTYPISTEVLYASARIETLYRMEKIACEKISDGDKIIAATSIILNAPIITANGRDFPWPYFKEIDRTPVIYTEKNISKVILVSFFQPDLNYLVQRFKERP
jgi:predicted nucleic acid-binding protein